MPIYPLLKDGGFNPTHIEAMGTAFEDVLRTLRLTDRTDPLVMLIAEKIIELGQRGVRDPQQLRDLALAEIKG
ncbi:MAG: hypothetical protein ACRECO_18455 [Xanthobacteraceae bacterium]